MHEENFCGQIERGDPYQVRAFWVFFHFFARPKGDEFLIHYEYVAGKLSN